MKTSRKEIEEIFRVNQLGCNDHVMPSIDDWNKIGAHIDELTAQVEWFKAVVSEMNDYLNTNKLTNIASSSIFHKRMGELLISMGEDK